VLENCSTRPPGLRSTATFNIRIITRSVSKRAAINVKKGAQTDLATFCESNDLQAMKHKNITLTYGDYRPASMHGHHLTALLHNVHLAQQAISL
jgi:hypothetical protein